MKKSELLNFDLVIFRCGNRCFKWNDVFISAASTPVFLWLLTSFNDDLTYENNKSQDIVEVRRFCPLSFAGVSITSLHSFMCNLLSPGPDFDKYMKVIWKRAPEVKEVTMDEIAERFGVSVENLKIKK